MRIQIAIASAIAAVTTALSPAAFAQSPPRIPPTPPAGPPAEPSPPAAPATEPPPPASQDHAETPVSGPGGNGTAGAETKGGVPVESHSETNAVTPMGGPVAEAKPAVHELPEWLRGVTLGAGALLWYYQPIVPRAVGVENNVSVFWAHLLVDGKWGPFALHLEPRFRDTPLRTITANLDGTTVVTYTQDDRAWLQEAYASADVSILGAQLKLGKEFSHFGYFWDGSFYGNVQVYDGLKLDPDYGASLEGTAGKADDGGFELDWWAQYFVVDGSTNVSLPGRDTISIPGARRRNQTVARLEPHIKEGPVTVAIGVSGEYLQADLPTIGPQNVWRGAVDATIGVGGLKILAEVQHQSGRHVTDFPFPSSAAGPGSSKNVDYGQVGGQYTLGPVTARYYVSTGIYNNAPLPTGGTATVKEWLHVPALAFAVSPNISLLGELVFWSHNTPTASVLYDRSFNLTLYAHL